MVLAAQLSERLGCIDRATTSTRIARCSRARDCRSRRRISASTAISSLMGHDKKVEGGRLKFILLRAHRQRLSSAKRRAHALAEVLERPSVHA